MLTFDQIVKYFLLLLKGQNQSAATFCSKEDYPDIYVDVLVIWPGSGNSHIEEYWTLPVGQFFSLIEGTGTNLNQLPNPGLMSIAR